MPQDDPIRKIRIRTFLPPPGMPVTTVVTENRKTGKVSTLDYHAPESSPRPFPAHPEPMSPRGLVSPSVPHHRGNTPSAACPPPPNGEPLHRLVTSANLFWVKPILDKAEFHLLALSQMETRRAAVRSKMEKRQIDYLENNFK